MYKLDSDKVLYLRNEKSISSPKNEFVKAWSGIILLVETTPNSGEPDYKEHRKKEVFDFAQKIILLLAGALIFGLAYFYKSIYPNLGISLLLLINLIGAYIGYLLVLKQMHINSQYADKICSLFHQSDCNNVLESDAAKLGMESEDAVAGNADDFGTCV